jgi:hypothetical protein
MTPFTDDVDLTRGDRRTYTDAATAQRAKDFESVDVSFENDGQNATARRSDKGSGQPHGPADGGAQGGDHRDHGGVGPYG